MSVTSSDWASHSIDHAKRPYSRHSCTSTSSSIATTGYIGTRWRTRMLNDPVAALRASSYPASHRPAVMRRLNLYSYLQPCQSASRLIRVRLSSSRIPLYQPCRSKKVSHRNRTRYSPPAAGLINASYQATSLRAIPQLPG